MRGSPWPELLALAIPTDEWDILYRLRLQIERDSPRRDDGTGRCHMSMDAELVRERAQAVCDALLASDVERATADFSEGLRHNLGQIMAQLPLPLTEATVESVELGGSSYTAVLLLIGESEVRMQTRWKDRDGSPTIVEVSHVSETAIEPATLEGDTDTEA